MNESVSRRKFLSRGITGLSAVWVSAHLPALAAAAGHARRAASSATPPKFEFFTQDEAAEIEAITARIIPTDETPGAREAGIVYFIDRGLASFYAEEQKTYRDGLPELEAKAKEMFPGAAKFSSLSPEQQDGLLHSFDENVAAGQRPRRARSGAQNFFETVRQHTIAGFLIDPDYGGNHEGVGWKLIGREREHMFQAPFGYYDKDYPGWEAAMKEAEKK